MQTDEHEPAEHLPPPPSTGQVLQAVIDLLDEVDEAFNADRWAVLNARREHSTWLLYDGAALRHCCRLLYEIETAATAGLELSARMLSRAHMEAWFVALYIHYGGHDALLKVAQDSRQELEGIEREAQEFNTWLATEKERATERGMKVARNNDGMAKWNAANPEAPAKTLLDEPYVPKLSTINVDLTEAIDGLSAHPAQGLPIKNIVDVLTGLGPQKGFSRESLRPMYVIYRTLSTIGTHTNISILDAYFMPGGFIRIAPMPINGSVIDTIRVSSLYSTAFLAGCVLGDHGTETPIADEIRDWLKPDPSGRTTWASGLRSAAPA